MRRLRAVWVIVGIVSVLLSSSGFAAANATCLTPSAPRYYPQIPEQITSPEMALQAYFDALHFASNLSAEQMGIVGGTVGSGKQPYEQAYRYWSAAWRAENPFDAYVDSWAGTVQVVLHRMCSAGVVDGVHRFFVETQHMEVVDHPVRRVGSFLYSGYFSVAQVDGEWKIVDGKLTPQNPAWYVSGHQPWRLDPAQVAVAVVSEVASPSGALLIDSEPGGMSTVVVLAEDSKVGYLVRLVERLDGTWEAFNITGGQRITLP